MGISKDEQSNRRAPKTTASGTSPYSGTQVQTGNGGLDWGYADNALLQRCTSAVTARGDAISFARGAHGAWLSLTILSGGEKYKKVAFTLEEADYILEQTAKEAQA